MHDCSDVPHHSIDPTYINTHKGVRRSKRVRGEVEERSKAGQKLVEQSVKDGRRLVEEGLKSGQRLVQERSK
jgi:hypothetical protein